MVYIHLSLCTIYYWYITICLQVNNIFVIILTISQHNSIIILWPVVIRREKMITYILNHTHEDGFNTFGISAFCGKKLIKSVSGISESISWNDGACRNVQRIWAWTLPAWRYHRRLSYWFHTLIYKDFNFCHNRGTIVFNVLSDIIYQTIRWYHDLQFMSEKMRCCSYCPQRKRIL